MGWLRHRFMETMQNILIILLIVNLPPALYVSFCLVLLSLSVPTRLCNYHIIFLFVCIHLRVRS